MAKIIKNRIDIYLVIICIIQIIALAQIYFALNLPGSAHYLRKMDIWIWRGFMFSISLMIISYILIFRIGNKKLKILMFLLNCIITFFLFGALVNDAMSSMRHRYPGENDSKSKYR
jgi:hypothetical protein